MKNLLKLSLLAVLLFGSVAVYADGNMSTGNRTCTENCGFAAPSSDADADTTEIKTDNDGVVDSILVWIESTLTDLAF